MTNLTHNFFLCISILYVFRATPCSTTGESVVSIQPLVYVALCRWPFRVQVGQELSGLYTKRSPTQSDIYQRLYWYNWFSWWWARGCSKHVENWNKYIEKNCASVLSFTKYHNEMHGQQNANYSVLFVELGPSLTEPCSLVIINCYLTASKTVCYAMLSYAMLCPCHERIYERD